MAVKDLLARPLAVKLSRYTVGSVVATGVGQGSFLLLYALGTPARLTAVLAYLFGFVPNYLLNRAWTWRRRGRPSLRGELLPYVAVIVVSIALASWGTALAEAGVERLGVSRGVQVLLVTGAFAVINLLLFLGKFVLFDRVLFADQPRRAPWTAKE